MGQLSGMCRGCWSVPQANLKSNDFIVAAVSQCDDASLFASEEDLEAVKVVLAAGEWACARIRL